MDNQQESTPMLSPAVSWTAWLGGFVQKIWRQLTLRPAAATTASPVRPHPKAQLLLQITVPDARRDVRCMTLIGALNHATYAGLVETAVAHYRQGNQYLVLDLHQVTELKLSGLFALVNIARLYSGRSLLDPEGGWLVIGQAAAECTPDLAQHVKLLAPSHVAESALRSVHYGQFFERHADLSSALAAFAADEQMSAGGVNPAQTD